MPSKSGNVEVASVPEEVTGQPRRVVLGDLLWQQTFSALRHRNFRLFFAGQLISLIGTWMQNTAQGWLVYQLTGSKMLLGVVAAVGSAPMMLFSIWAGALADRYPKRLILLSSSVGWSRNRSWMTTRICSRGKRSRYGVSLAWYRLREMYWLAGSRSASWGGRSSSFSRT